MKDEVLAADKWVFDEAVTDVFDDMLARSIPDLQGLRRVCTELAGRFAQSGTSIVDLGCSRGAALKPIMELLGDSVSYVGVEVSEPMREAAKTEIPDANIVNIDLREDYPAAPASVTISCLTLQFTPIEYRQRILTDAFKHTTPGGCLLLFEKVLGRDSFTDQMLIDTYLARKGENGYTQEQIQNKRRSLEGVLVPVTAAWNEEMLRTAGFHHVEPVWRQLNFAGWVAVRQ